MNIFDKYMGSTAFLRSPDDGSGAAPTTPTPVAAAAPVASEAPAAPVVESGGDDFSGFDGAGDDDGLESIDLGTPTAVSQEPVVAAPAAAPVPPAPATAAPAAPAAPVAAAPTTEGVAPPSSELDTLVQSLDTNAPALTDWLASNAFALTKEEAEAFELDAVAAVPKLMARVAVNNMKSTMNIVKNLVPQLIAREVAKITSSTTKAKEAIDEFYSSNPHLNVKDHGELVTKWANAFRAANPKASRKDAIAYVGRAVSFEAGVTPGTPAAPRAAPFSPAVPGGRAPVVSTNVDQNPFQDLGMDMDE